MRIEPLITKSRYLHLFIDVETTDIGPTAFPWQIGIIGIVENVITHELDLVINTELTIKVPDSLVRACMDGDEGHFDRFSISRSTINWIMTKASESTRTAWKRASSLFSDPTVEHPADAAETVVGLITDAMKEYVNIDTDIDWTQCYIYSWGQFDVPILVNFLTATGFDKPWHYRNEIDLRSVIGFYGINERPDTSAHVGLADARALYELWRKLRIEYSAPAKLQLELSGI